MPSIRTSNNPLEKTDMMTAVDLNGLEQAVAALGGGPEVWARLESDERTIELVAGVLAGTLTAMPRNQLEIARCAPSPDTRIQGLDAFMDATSRSPREVAECLTQIIEDQDQFPAVIDAARQHLDTLQTGQTG